jgi:hypothetical protein
MVLWLVNNKLGSGSLQEIAISFEAQSFYFYMQGLRKATECLNQFGASPR